MCAGDRAATSPSSSSNSSCCRACWSISRARQPGSEAELPADLDVSGKAVLVRFGWDRHWGDELYRNPPYHQPALAAVPDRRRRKARTASIRWNADSGRMPSGPPIAGCCARRAHRREPAQSRRPSAGHAFRFFAVPIKVARRRLDADPRLRRGDMTMNKASQADRHARRSAGASDRIPDGRSEAARARGDERDASSPSPPARSAGSRRSRAGWRAWQGRHPPLIERPRVCGVRRQPRRRGTRRVGLSGRGDGADGAELRRRRGRHQPALQGRRRRAARLRDGARPADRGLHGRARR